MKKVLASKSPRRQEILKSNNIDYTIQVSDIEEVFNYDLPVQDAVADLAYQKASNVFNHLVDKEDTIVIGADTIVVIDDIVLGKPKSYEHAFVMLSALQGKEHQVMTGVALMTKTKVQKFVEITNVYFKPMSSEEITEYINSENVYDKAGSYAIQGNAGKYIEKIEGDYYNVMGLPINRLKRELKKIEEE